MIILRCLIKNKVNIVNAITWDHHRSGWRYVISLLDKYSNKDGILLDSSLDNTFGEIKTSSTEANTKSYDRDWIGFLHNPINICPWYGAKNLSPLYVLNSLPFINSLSHCKGIFTLSSHLSNYVIEKTNGQVNVFNLLHPTETPRLKFNINRFNTDKKVIQIGTWMRKLSSFFLLHAQGYKKYIPINKLTIFYLQKEIAYLKNLNEDSISSVIKIPYLDNRMYDELLSESIVFLDLYDSSANNAIIECIVRNTPIVVNKLPAVVEYLGIDYPLYYENLEEADYLLQRNEKIKDAHEFLKNLSEKKRFDGSYFLRSFFSSAAFTT